MTWDNRLIIKTVEMSLSLGTDHYFFLCYARFGEFKKKIVCTAGVEENFQVLNRWWKKFPASQKSRYPRGK